MTLGLQGTTTFTITFIIAVMMISSPVFMFDSPTHVSAAGTDDPNRVDIRSYHSTPRVESPLSSTSSHPSIPTAAIGPSTLSQNGDDFTTQAALSLSRATQTSNIVDSKAYYDISFRTSTSGVIKFIRMSFPPGTYLGAAHLIEATGIGLGKISAGSTGNTLAYIVTNAVNVPENTNIRIQIANANNPPTPSNSLTVRITTRDSSDTIIDGPTSTFAYNIKQIGTGQIADGAITAEKIADSTIGSNDLDDMLIISRLLLDNARGASFGWNPSGTATDFIIFDEAVLESSAVLINVGDFESNSQCEALGSLDGFFTIRCNIAPPQGSELRYTITNIPLS